MANPSHKRETNARRTRKAALVAAPIAAVVTLGTVGLGVVSSAPGDGVGVITAPNSFAEIVAERQQVVSRSAARSAANLEAETLGPQVTKAAKRQDRKQRAIEEADQPRWSTAELNLWLGPGDAAKREGVLEAGKKVLATGRSNRDRAEIVLGKKAFWVTAEYLADEKPPEGPSTAPCANGVSASGGANVQKVLRATCAFAPEIRSYGGNRRSGGDHGRGRALDIMVRGERGWEIAEFLRANRVQLGISYLIYSQKIWSVERSGEGWRPMSNRGSDTANHYDHVHVSVY